MFSNMILAVSKSSAGGPSLLAIISVYLLIYLLPSIIALIKRNRRTKVILFNVFLGWTLVMWIISLVWACKKEANIPNVLSVGLSPADELKTYKDLLDAGAITQEEFDAKKEQLLGI